MASAVILPRPRPPGASSHLRHGDKETEALTAAAAAAAGKHSELNRLIPAAINTAVTRRKKTTARLILGETRQDKSLPPTGSRGRDSQRPNRGAKGRTGRRGRVGRLRRELWDSRLVSGRIGPMAGREREAIRGIPEKLPRESRSERADQGGCSCPSGHQGELSQAGREQDGKATMHACRRQGAQLQLLAWWGKT